MEGLDPGHIRPSKVVLTTDRLWALAASLPLICELPVLFLSSGLLFQAYCHVFRHHLLSSLATYTQHTHTQG
jgi:hypothetical protein